MATVITGTGGIETPKVKAGSINIAIPGERRNMYASVLDAGSFTVTFSFNYHIVASPTGEMTLRDLSASGLPFDIRVSGVGGMSSPSTTGWIAVYHIHNASNNSDAAYGIPVTVSNSAPEVLDAATLPSGYTHSALMGIFPLVAANNALKAATLRERHCACSFGPVVTIDGNYATNPFLWVDGANYPPNIKSLDLSVTLALATGSVPAAGAMLRALIVPVDTANTSTSGRGELVVGGALLSGASVSVQGSGTIHMTGARQAQVFTADLTSISATQRTSIFHSGFGF